MDEILSKEEFLELKQMYENENRQYQKELEKLKQEEQKQQTAENHRNYSFSHLQFPAWRHTL